MALGGGAIAGIVIGSIIVIGGVAAAAYYFLVLKPQSEGGGGSGKGAEEGKTPVNNGGNKDYKATEAGAGGNTANANGGRRNEPAHSRGLDAPLDAPLDDVDSNPRNSVASNVELIGPGGAGAAGVSTPPQQRPMAKAADKLRPVPEIPGATGLYLVDESKLARMYACQLNGSDVWLRAFDLLADAENERAIFSRVNGLQNIVPLIDLGVDDPAVIGFPALEGGTLAEVLQAAPDLSTDDALGIALGVCRGLAALHSHGVAHMSVSPKIAGFVNEIGSGGEIETLLFDFLPAIIVGESALHLNRVSVKYAAPELLNLFPPAKASPASIPYYTSVDVYAFGVLLWELITGHPPHMRISDKEALNMARSSPDEFRVNPSAIVLPDIRELVTLLVSPIDSRPRDLVSVLPELEKIVQTRANRRQTTDKPLKNADEETAQLLEKIVGDGKGSDAVGMTTVRKSEPGLATAMETDGVLAAIAAAAAAAGADAGTSSPRKPDPIAEEPEDGESGDEVTENFYIPKPSGDTQGREAGLATTQETDKFLADLMKDGGPGAQTNPGGRVDSQTTFRAGGGAAVAADPNAVDRLTTAQETSEILKAIAEQSKQTQFQAGGGMQSISRSGTQSSAHATRATAGLSTQRETEDMLKEIAAAARAAEAQGGARV